MVETEIVFHYFGESKLKMTNLFTNLLVLKKSNTVNLSYELIFLNK